MQTIDPILPPRPRQQVLPAHRPDLGPPPSPRGPSVGRSVDGVMPPPRPRSVPSVAPSVISPVSLPHPPVPPPRPSLSLSPSSLPAAKQPVVSHAPPTEQNVYSRTSVRPARPGFQHFDEARFTKKKIAIGVLTVFILIGGALVTQQPLGQVLVLAYGVVALVKHIPSRTTFTLALITLALIPVSLTLIGGTNTISSAFATYAFLLLVIGTITLGLELRREPERAHTAHA